MTNIKSVAEQHLKKVETFSNLHKVSISPRSEAVESQEGIRKEGEKERQGDHVKT